MSCLPLAWRRGLMVFLVGGTLLLAGAWMVDLLAAGGLSPVELAMLACFAVTTPWIALGFWNGAVGMLLLHGARRPLEAVAPFVRGLDDTAPIATRTAVIMPVRNEDPERVFSHLRAVIDSLDATERGAAFDFFLLSDSDDPAITAEEERRFSALRAQDPRPARLVYRRRGNNAGRKVGNIRDFCDRWGDAYSFFLVLDADSVMSGSAILRLVRLMQARPRIGILQTLAVGLPSRSPFTRLFQFGMRQAMRPFSFGSAWWQGDQGPYWGHNAIIRMRPFREACALPSLPGRPPFGGDILSHDQVEAVLMSRAGYQVRLLPLEDGSYEENPPTLLDFIKRECRWCQGNLQYLRLLGLPGLRPLGRVQLVIAIAMYLSAPAWIGFLALALLRAFVDEPGATGAPAEPLWGVDGLTFLCIMMALTFAPKLFGILDILLRRQARAAYGGVRRTLASAGLETLFAVLLGPVMAVALTVFIAGLLAGRAIGWNQQVRDSHLVRWRAAAVVLWPQTLLGLLFGLLLYLQSPLALIWAAPVLLGLLLAIPFAALTSWPALGRLLQSRGLCLTAEELRPPADLRRLGLRAFDPAPVQEAHYPMPAQLAPAEVPRQTLRERNRAQAERSRS